MSACLSIDAGEVRRILALEQRTSEAAREVQVRCDDSTAQLTSRDVTRTLALESVPAPLRARLLALAIAELDQHPQAAERRTAPVVPVPVVEVATKTQRFRLWAGAYGQRGSAWAGGAMLAFSAQLRGSWAWSSGVAFTQATTDVDRGRLRVRHAALFTGPALQHEFGRISLLGGLGIRAGWLGLRGVPGDPDVRGQRFDTWFVGPTAFANISVRCFAHGFAVIALELSNTLREVNAEVRGGDARTLSAWLAGAALGMGASW